MGRRFACAVVPSVCMQLSWALCLDDTLHSAPGPRIEVQLAHVQAQVKAAVHVAVASVLHLL